MMHELARMRVLLGRPSQFGAIERVAAITLEMIEMAG
jgi:hypothetical protein